MKGKFFLTVTFVLLFIYSAFAQVTIKAQVDKTKVTTDETLIYKVTIASPEANLAQPQIPKFTGFNLLSQSQSTTLALERNGLKTFLVYEFILLPVSAGKLKIDPTTIKIKGQTLSTDSFEIEVTLGKFKAQTLPEENPSLPQKAFPESAEPQITL